MRIYDAKQTSFGGAGALQLGVSHAATAYRSTKNSEEPKFFSACWFPFVKSVEGIPAHRPTDKSMMNEYKAAFNSDAWKINGQNRCYADESLWDWNAKVLEPLVAFLDCVMNDDAVENLGDLLK